MASTWETLEERERRVRGTRTTSAMARAAEQIPEARTLAAAFAERPFISREDLRAIARQQYERPVITFYLNLSPERLVRADPPVFVSVFHSLRHRELEAIMEEQRRVLLVDVTKEKTTFSLYELGFEEPVHAITSSVPHNELEPSRKDEVQRHRLTHLQWHFKSSAQTAERLFRERRCELLALLGEETLLKEFEDYLPKSLRDRLLAELHLSPEDGPNERRDALEESLAKQRKQEEETALGELGFFQGHGRLAAGLEKVLDAANLFLMRRVFLDTELARPGYVCRDHHFLPLKAGSCPFDGRALLPAESVVDELVEIARLHGVEVMLVEQRRDLLAPYGGAAAVLVTAGPLDELRTVSVTSG